MAPGGRRGWGWQSHRSSRRGRAARQIDLNVKGRRQRRAPLHISPLCREQPQRRTNAAFLVSVVSLGGAPPNRFVAYEGSQIKLAVTDFLSAAAGIAKERLSPKRRSGGVTITHATASNDARAA